MTSQRKAAWNESTAKLTRFAASTARWSIGAARSRMAKGLSAAMALPRATMELVFPDACVGCHAELNSETARAVDLPFCGVCFDELELLPEPMCPRCGGPLPELSNVAEKREDCFRCQDHKLWFHETIAAGLYAGQ